MKDSLHDPYPTPAQQSAPPEAPASERSFARQLAAEAAVEIPRAIGGLAIYFLGILGLIVVGTGISAAGLLFQNWYLAIFGGLLALAGVVWGALLLMFWDW